ncbi:MAG: UbiA family prenyltransferase [Desulfatitalea sp.]|nr:UbiA family prenyltransferase [Desulfatitalea sp.]NNK02231.1 UbiA family prenyltransferase [Desulfatitalea sp.]
MNSMLLHRLKLYFALSRTPHGLIDMAAPALAALLCLGRFPSAVVTLVGLVTVFAGYTAVYALNDLVDFQVDRQKADLGGFGDTYNDIDGALPRHPMAQGALSFGAGLLWTCAWAAVALTGAYWLNPVCLYLFLAGCLLEAVYCKLLHLTPLRAVLNGVVKTLGALAAAFAVNPSPSPLFLALLFGWLFFWEIGGQNIPNDWTDIEEDRRLKARTIPLRIGRHRATLLIVVCLIGALLMNLLLFWASPLDFGLFDLVAVLAVNVALLLHPAQRLVENHERRFAMALFTKASYYPLCLLVLVLVRLGLAAG